MSDEATTQPTIQTLLDRMDAQTAEMRRGFATLEERLNVRFDRTQSLIHDVRADCQELRGQLRELILSLN